MITKNDTGTILLLKWLLANASKDPARLALQCIHVVRVPGASVLLEACNGFAYVHVSISGKEADGFLPDVTSGLYGVTLFSKGVVEWTPAVDLTYPDTAAIVSNSPSLFPPEGKMISVLHSVDPSLLVKFLVTFLGSITLCMNGKMLNMYGTGDVGDWFVEIGGILMPMRKEDNWHNFDPKASVCVQKHGNAWMEVLDQKPVLSF